MAFLAKTLSCFFLLVLVSSFQIQDRESKFFNKFIHISTKIKVIPESQISQAPTSAPALAPTPETVPTIAAEAVTAPAEAPASFYAERGNGYGLYGHGSGLFPPTKETVPSTTNENNLSNEELSAENYRTGYQNSNYKNNVYASNYNNNNNDGYNSIYNNNGYSSNYNTNGYVTEKQGMSDTRFMKNYQNNNYNDKYTSYNNYNNREYTNGINYRNNVYASSYSTNGYSGSNNNNGYSSNYNTESYETEKKGISDTRFLENGKYYYDVKNENNYFPTGFESERVATTNEGYYGNTQNANEFNAMEEFENKQEYQESTENYVP